MSEEKKKRSVLNWLGVGVGLLVILFFASLALIILSRLFAMYYIDFLDIEVRNFFDVTKEILVIIPAIFMSAIISTTIILLFIDKKINSLKEQMIKKEKEG